MKVKEIKDGINKYLFIQYKKNPTALEIPISFISQDGHLYIGAAESDTAITTARAVSLLRKSNYCGQSLPSLYGKVLKEKRIDLNTTSKESPFELALSSKALRLKAKSLGRFQIQLGRRIQTTVNKKRVHKDVWSAIQYVYVSEIYPTSTNQPSINPTFSKTLTANYTVEPTQQTTQTAVFTTTIQPTLEISKSPAPTNTLPPLYSHTPTSTVTSPPTQPATQTPSPTITERHTLEAPQSPVPTEISLEPTLHSTPEANNSPLSDIEVCNNQIDDNSDGRIDCSDTACQDGIFCVKKAYVTFSIPNGQDVYLECGQSTLPLKIQVDPVSDFEIPFPLKFIHNGSELFHISSQGSHLTNLSVYPNTTGLVEVKRVDSDETLARFEFITRTNCPEFEYSTPSVQDTPLPEPSTEPTQPHYVSPSPEPTLYEGNQTPTPEATSSSDKGKCCLCFYYSDFPEDCPIWFGQVQGCTSRRTRMIVDSFDTFGIIQSTSKETCSVDDDIVTYVSKHGSKDQTCEPFDYAYTILDSVPNANSLDITVDACLMFSNLQIAEATAEALRKTLQNRGCRATVSVTSNQNATAGNCVDPKNTNSSLVTYRVCTSNTTCTIHNCQPIGSECFYHAANGAVACRDPSTGQETTQRCAGSDNSTTGTWTRG